MAKVQVGTNPEIDMNPIRIEGIEYYTVKQFAILTNHSAQAIRRLIKIGNKQRCLKANYFADKPFIPVTELCEFPFTVTGTSEEVYFYGKD